MDKITPTMLTHLKRIGIHPTSNVPSPTKRALFRRGLVQYVVEVSFGVRFSYVEITRKGRRLLKKIGAVK